MNTEDLKILKDLVRGEAANLREAITEEEASNLNFANLNASNAFGCIYGQMTGYCYSDRAQNLIESCCQRVFNVVVSGWEAIKESILNGPPRSINPSDRSSEYFSPIEKFLFFSTPEEQQNLIKYLKKEVETLDI